MDLERRSIAVLLGTPMVALIAGAVCACRSNAEQLRKLPTRADLGQLRGVYGQPLYSQDDEETLIRAFLGDRRGGLFVDVGSGDPIQHSTTYYLEKHLGWHGIAIDAVGEYAEPYARLRPATRFFNYFAGKSSGDRLPFFVREDRNFSSSNPSEDRGGATQERQVTTVALDDLLRRENVSSVDFLSMDIEGAEPLALAGFDVERYRPDLVCIEIASPEAGRAVAEYFAIHHCREVTAYRPLDWINRYYTCR